uniref:Thioredoxin domain-containing protein n=1 Tax=Chromera velia CCMP2878 TaxID=1169474 RepID=A0A0G4FAR2_9ALVE|eukprot:Cvel_15931.t1-p1 / transcript=Cvel_15931.t1 / gene=Cvel_15931 / organism=Chromera_velia_CCMP2878 / gene_product=Thioredoxin domain-containing protein 5, putative / transcript_product=Thioredoxin domain-containing protein 5, putative / location=Cvel_scaffold1205:5908-7007(+) / protein_length=306 / sequence_SO=supercontig / SO=protein_coding / is_pseudo=false
MSLGFVRYLASVVVFAATISVASAGSSTQPQGTISDTAAADASCQFTDGLAFVEQSQLSKKSTHGEDLFLLTDDDFEEATSSAPTWVFSLYVDGCGACKAFHPHLKEVAKRFRGDSNVQFALIDQTASVTGIRNALATPKHFPTKVKIGDRLYDYTESRDADSLERFIKEEHKQEGMFRTLEKDWNLIPDMFKGEFSQVENFSAKGFRQNVKNGNRRWLVYFFAPSCSHCQQATISVEKAAKARKQRVTFGRVDCSLKRAAEICTEEGVTSMPTIRVYEGGAHTKTYDGSHTHDALVNFVETTATA